MCGVCSTHIKECCGSLPVLDSHRHYARTVKGLANTGLVNMQYNTLCQEDMSTPTHSEHKEKTKVLLQSGLYHFVMNSDSKDCKYIAYPWILDLLQLQNV